MWYFYFHWWIFGIVCLWVSTFGMVNIGSPRAAIPVSSQTLLILWVVLRQSNYQIQSMTNNTLKSVQKLRLREGQVRLEVHIMNSLVNPVLVNIRFNIATTFDAPRANASAVTPLEDLTLETTRSRVRAQPRISYLPICLVITVLPHPIHEKHPVRSRLSIRGVVQLWFRVSRLPPQLPRRVRLALVKP